jgi:outer membrane protein OmpA-like peptidoglycan-associated protein
MRTLLAILIFCSAFSLSGQHRFTILPVQSVNTTRNDILCGFMDGLPIIVSNDRQDLVNDYAWDTHMIYQLRIARRGDTYYDLHSPSKLLPFPGVRNEGTASYDPGDSTLYFSSAENYGNARGNSLKIYKTRWDGRKWSPPQLLPFCSGGADYAHPFFDARLKVLVFSSNRIGGSGGMDIWYTYLSGQDWSEPVNPGVMVNTPGNEIFPSVFRGDIYFSSDGILPSRGYELFYCEKKSQWKAAVQLPDPLNSPEDDVMIVFLNENKGFVTSSRAGGKGGDDIYLFTREDFGLPANTFRAELEVKGARYPAATITVTNELKEVLLQGTTDEQGVIDLKSLPMGQRLRFQVTGMSPALFPDCILYLVDEKGNRVRELRLNEFGWVELELLPLDYSEVELFPNADKSWLSVSIEGRLEGQEPAAVREGEMITIVDDQERPVAVAYTRSNGSFSFSELSPDLAYTFRLAPESRVSQIVVFEKGKEIMLPVLREEAVYRRIRENEAIAIVNEQDRVVYVSPDDLFVINRIYYEYASAGLTEEARIQLEQLAWLMRRNLALKIEISSHTDARGSSAANLRLSQDRAESVSRYLISEGIAASRIMAKGRGEEVLLNRCGDGVNCSEDEHAINRRTDIRFLTR